MDMSEKMISASVFKARCLALMEDVAHSGETLVVTKRGRALVRVVPLDSPRPLTGSVRFHVDDRKLLEPLEDSWDAESA